MLSRLTPIIIVAAVPVVSYIFFILWRTLKFYFSGLFKEPESGVKRKVTVKRLVIAVVIAALSTYIGYMCTNFFSLRAMIILHILAASLVVDFINLVIWLIRKKKVPELWIKLRKSCIMPIFLTAAILLLGVINMYDVEEKDYTIYTDKQIREEGYTIALIADLHLGTGIGLDALQETFNDIEKKEPDMIVLAGDIFDESSKLNEMLVAAEIMGSAKSTYGTFYVYGNHDRATYSRNADYSPEDLKNCLTSNGITILSDRVYEINDEFTIIGRADARFSGNSGRMTAEKLISETDLEDFILLVDHQPLELESNSRLGFDLQLSGHTHGGQIWPVGPISELAGINELTYGHKQIGDFQVIVTSGIAGWGYPIKTGADSEYVIIEVK